LCRELISQSTKWTSLVLKVEWVTWAPLLALLLKFKDTLLLRLLTSLISTQFKFSKMRQHIIRGILEMNMEALLTQYHHKVMGEWRFSSSKLRMYLIPAFRKSGKIMKKIKFYHKTVNYFRHKKTIAFIAKTSKIRTERLINHAKA
jgi:hypothetical protein